MGRRTVRLRDRLRPAWLTTPILTVALVSIGAGIAQFSVPAVMGDVAATFGEPGVGDDLATQIGLPTTTVGIAFAVVRLSSLGALPAAAMADRIGRRRLLLTVVAIGLAFTTTAAISPGFWWYVALVSLARPMLSAVNAVAGVVAAEETRAASRSWAVALITAAYGLGAGIVAISRSVLPGAPSFRLITGLALIPLLLLPLLARYIREPPIAARAEHAIGLPGTVPAGHRARVALIAGLTGVLALATGPAFTFLFVYTERVLGASPDFSAALIFAAGPLGLIGILTGRAVSDHVGRRVAAGTLMAITGAAIAYGYAGGTTGTFAVGYLVAIAASAGFAPPAVALAAELFPTSIRATAAGWVTTAGVVGAVGGLLLFGLLADAAGSFAFASLVVALPVTIAAAGFAFLPETRGTELEETPVQHERR